MNRFIVFQGHPAWRSLVALITLLVCATPGRAQQDGGSGPHSSLLVTATVEGTAADACDVQAYPAGGLSVERGEPASPVWSGKTGETAPVEPGRLDLVVQCTSAESGGTLKTLVPDVVVKLGKPTAVVVPMQAAALVVHGLRNGTRVKSESVVTLAGTTETVAKGQGGLRMEVASGLHDIRLTAEVGGETYDVTLEKQKVPSGGLHVVNVDLSPGQLLLTVTRNGKPVEGVGALTAPNSKSRIKEFDAGETVEVAAGVYDVLAGLRDSFDFVEKRQRRVTVAPGKVNRVQVDFPRGTVVASCQVDGAQVPGKVHGFLPGAEEPFNSAACGDRLDLAPGKYHLRFVMDGTAATHQMLGQGAPEVWQRNVGVDKGKDKTVVADFSPAELTVVASKNGEFSEAEIRILQWGPRGPVFLGTGQSGQFVRVPPGTYDAEVVWPAGGKQDAPTEMIRGIVCEAHRACYGEANLERATIVIEVYKNGSQLMTAQVLLYKASGQDAYVQGMSGDALEVPPGAYIPEVRSGTVTRQFSKMRVRAGVREERRVEIE